MVLQQAQQVGSHDLRANEVTRTMESNASYVGLTKLLVFEALIA